MSYYKTLLTSCKASSSTKADHRNGLPSTHSIPFAQVTLCNLPPKTNSETTPTNSLYIMQTLANHFRKVVYTLLLDSNLDWLLYLALLLIMLAFLAIVQQRRGLKV